MHKSKAKLKLKKKCSSYPKSLCPIFNVMCIFLLLFVLVCVCVRARALVHARKGVKCPVINGGFLFPLPPLTLHPLRALPGEQVRKGYKPPCCLMEGGGLWKMH